LLVGPFPNLDDQTLILTKNGANGVTLPFFTQAKRKPTKKWCLIDREHYRPTNEEKHMNKLIITLLTTTMLIATGPAVARGPYGEPGNKDQRHQQGMPAVQQLMRGIRNLDLSEEQKESIQTVMQGLKAEVRPLMQETKAGQLQLKELIKADSYDETAVAALAENEGKLAAKRVLITSHALSEVLSHLTDEQRDELDAMAVHRKQHRAERRAQRPSQS
jgi:protein CpxP